MACIETAAGFRSTAGRRGPSDPRIEDVDGDIYVNWTMQADWGLHLIDFNVALGNLVEIVAEQSRAYPKR